VPKLKHFEEVPVVAVLRGITSDKADKVIETCIRAGLKTIEFTFDTPGIADLLISTAAKFGQDINLGCGTIFQLDQAKQAVEAGAEYIVAPTLNPEIAKWCAANDIAYMPGALTPQEIEEAWSHNPYMVKIFPVGPVGGPAYIKQLRGPFGKKGAEPVKLIVTGGVYSSNITEYFEAGVDAVGVGGSTFDDAIANSDWETLETTLKEIVNKAKTSSK